MLARIGRMPVGSPTFLISNAPWSTVRVSVFLVIWTSPQAPRGKETLERFLLKMENLCGVAPDFAFRRSIRQRLLAGIGLLPPATDLNMEMGWKRGTNIKIQLLT